MKACMVMLIKKEQPIQLPFGTQTLPLSWADGMIGCVPVFESREAAEKYVEGDARDFTLQDIVINDEEFEELQP